MDPGPMFTIDTSSTVTCLLATNHYLPHHTFNPLLQQTGEVDNQLIRWGKVLSLCCAGLRVACNTYVTFPSSYWFDNLGFLPRENLLLYCFTPCSWGCQQAHISCACHQTSRFTWCFCSNCISSLVLGSLMHA